MNEALGKLLEGSSGPLGGSEVALGAPGERGRELVELLGLRNGFYAFGSALHVFAAPPAREGYDVESWNDPGLWRSEYGELADGHFFFAEDAFGNQFSLYDDHVVLFDAETAAVETLAADLAGWANRIVADHRVLTGWPLAVEWQEKHGPLPAGTRLLPRKPFVLGGDYAVENVRAVEAVEAMQYRGYVALRLKDVPDGTVVDLRPAPSQ